jgi:hypothetical protein
MSIFPKSKIAVVRLQGLDLGLPFQSGPLILIPNYEQLRKAWRKELMPCPNPRKSKPPSDAEPSS